MCEQRLSPLLSESEQVSEEEAGLLGRKEAEQEVEKFLAANSQELGKDKWLCPLSGKKFKVRPSAVFPLAVGAGLSEQAQST